MTALLIALFGIELVAYVVLLGRLASVTKTRRPALFAVVGRVPATDYFMLGFGPGDSFLSKLESHKGEVADEPEILGLMKALRGVYIALIATFSLGFVAMVAYAN
jgi:hypothetical protein